MTPSSTRSGDRVSTSGVQDAPDGRCEGRVVE